MPRTAWQTIASLAMSLSNPCQEYDQGGYCQFCDWCGDANSSACVDVVDLVIVLTAWGPMESAETVDWQPDFNDDGVVDVSDLIEVILSFGCQCPCEQP